eukprot:TRINITY_DN73576_c0_g1_i1.p1 TRINITY_DN73576_c0_g1~~TRINITY_DN73576_c0_g1_i1.p1  ORF type:complete len:795 (+),score=112.93 TRINITY_DN73576_c0_g1_i1:1-2385(+)
MELSCSSPSARRTSSITCLTRLVELMSSKSASMFAICALLGNLASVAAEGACAYPVSCAISQDTDDQSSTMLLQHNLNVEMGSDRSGKDSQDDVVVTQSWMADPTMDPDTRAALLLDQMTPDEKRHYLSGKCMHCPYVGLVSANDRLGIPALNTHDGPQGFRNMPGAKATSTSWPGGMAMAATWDKEALYEWGAAMGKEFKAKGANVALGPGLNIARVPLNGRNFEYMSGEDPYLGKVLAGPVVRGIQDQNVMACAKHWVVNSQETNRNAVSEDVDERTLFEVYYPPFEAAVEAGVGSVMCSYNRINSIYSCENAATLQGHLKDTLGFKGFVMSDWGATHKASIAQGLDMEMPVGLATSGLGMLLTGSTASDADVDGAVRRILRSMFQTGLFDQPAGTWSAAKFGANVSSVEADSLARRLGAQSTVLLKNAGGVLPLTPNRKLALIGFASENGLPLSFGHGSGEVYPSHYVSPLTGIKAAAGNDAQVLFSEGADLDEAADLAKSADYALVFVGGSATEGADRTSMSLDGACQVTTMQGQVVSCGGADQHQNALVASVAKANPKTIVVLSTPGAVLMPWSGEVAAILTNFMPGQQAGNAVADILFGKVNPSAKLPITMPNTDSDLGFEKDQWPGKASADGLVHAVYSEKLLVGYRQYDAKQIPFTTGFPFGHGLSYTSFDYRELEIQTGLSEHEPHARNVSFKVFNSGTMPGQETPQLYLSFPASAGEPRLQLKGFKKTQVIQPGSFETVSLKLSPRELSIWDASLHKWALVSGTFKVNVGSSSRDLRLEGDMTV